MAAAGGSGPVWMPELLKFLNLGVIIVGVYIFGRKGIYSALKTRSDDIAKKIVDAKVELERLQYESAKAHQELAQISKTKDQIISEMREEGLKTYEIMVSEATQTANRILADAKLAADNEVNSAIQRVKKELVDQAVKQARKIITEEKSKQVDLHDRLVEKFIIQLKEKDGLSNGI
jgi:F-type H+-transporting ATPase subunit b